MKAWSISKAGNPADALVLLSDVEAPSNPGPSEIIVKVMYAALNTADINLMRSIPDYLPFRGYRIPGLDFSGTVTAAGDQVPSHLAVGSEVCGALPILLVARGKGTLAEYLQIPHDLVALKPAKMSMAESAGLGIVTQTAIVMLQSQKLSAGDRILVQGASGGVGAMLTQMASARGLRVVGICSGANSAMVKGLGAEEMLDYTEAESLPDLICAHGPFDAVFNCVGDSDLYGSSTRFLKKDGMYIDIASPLGPIGSYWQQFATYLLPGYLYGRGQSKFKAANLAPSGSLQAEAVKSVNDGDIRQVPIDSEFPMDQLVRAYDRVSSKRAKGKVLVKVHDSG